MKKSVVWRHEFAFMLGCTLLVASTIAVAGPFSRAKTEGQRLDGAGVVEIEGIHVYSFLQEGAGGNGRLSRDLDKFLTVVGEALREKGIPVETKDLPAGTLVMEVAAHGPGGVAGSERVTPESSRIQATELVRERQSGEPISSSGHRLLLLPDKVVHSTGLQWGTRTIRTGSGALFRAGPQTSGVPSYSFRVYWLLEDENDRPVAAGTTTGILDVRGFPHKPMAEQMLAELERLGISWPK
ncbi:hypothetical protein [Pseudoxanthomonas broegbernensis]|uniref:hypothetical protein n=1 Tax=Pseudoxanthomonas broegbernensis TaxID=83619 RepID=UPI001391186B|nr:hypothetical protein [Pseudoxanthomonas broegbernensis]MBB6066469.1 hypothetical protein [Pseudoxanthomonas broegbernensis]